MVNKVFRPILSRFKKLIGGVQELLIFFINFLSMCSEKFNFSKLLRPSITIIHGPKGPNFGFLTFNMFLKTRHWARTFKNQNNVLYLVHT